MIHEYPTRYVYVQENGTTKSIPECPQQPQMPEQTREKTRRNTGSLDLRGSPGTFGFAESLKKIERKGKLEKVWPKRVYNGIKCAHR